MPDLWPLVAEMLPRGVTAGQADPRDTPHGLWQGEQIGPAVPKRLAEFAAGRRAARQALAAMGHPPCAIPVDPDRTPIWPEGISGSISHSDTACLAIVTPSSNWCGVGIDLEPALPLPDGIFAEILLPEEQKSCQSNLDPTIIFAIKEAAYKAQYPITKQMFGFDAMKVTLSTGSFTATLTSHQGNLVAGYEIHGKWGIAAGHIIALAAIAP